MLLMKSISLYRYNAILLLLILTTVVLYFGKELLVPLFFAILLAMLLLPVCRKLESWGVNRVWSTLTGILIIVAFIAGLITIIAAQGVSLSEDMPQMQSKAQQLIQNVQEWIQSRYGIAP